MTSATSYTVAKRVSFAKICCFTSIEACIMSLIFAIHSKFVKVVSQLQIWFWNTRTLEGIRAQRYLHFYVEVFLCLNGPGFQTMLYKLVVFMIAAKALQA